MQRVSDVALRLDGVAMNAARRGNPKGRRQLHLAGGRKIKKAAGVNYGLHRGRVRQWLQCVMQIDPGQRACQLAILRADALAIDDEKRRAKFVDEPSYLLWLEGINNTFAARHPNID